MRAFHLLTGAMLLVASATDASATVVDPTADFLSTYTGPPDSDVDLIGGEVVFDGTSFLFTATVAGAITPTPGQLYAWGINRGTGSPRLDLLRDP
ncbi:MAG TPA: hypothetical protein VFZ35_08265, partial [Sphingomicrobium sp.]